jgi:acylphosphatase
VSARAARFVISGRVQGVGYRAWTRREAHALGLSGSARNLVDGRVEVVVAGAPAALDAFAARLLVGPLLARVDAVDREIWNEPVTTGFVTA